MRCIKRCIKYYYYWLDRNRESNKEVVDVVFGFQLVGNCYIESAESGHRINLCIVPSLDFLQVAELKLIPLHFDIMGVMSQQILG